MRGGQVGKPCKSDVEVFVRRSTRPSVNINTRSPGRTSTEDDS